MSENIDNQIPNAFDQATPSEKMAPATKSPFGITEKRTIRINTMTN